jgi:hypothetical protein
MAIVHQCLFVLAYLLLTVSPCHGDERGLAEAVLAGFQTTVDVSDYVSGEQEIRSSKGNDRLNECRKICVMSSSVV